LLCSRGALSCLRPGTPRPLEDSSGYRPRAAATV
jgi:hypothetical protein